MRPCCPDRCQPVPRTQHPCSWPEMNSKLSLQVSFFCFLKGSLCTHWQRQTVVRSWRHQVPGGGKPTRGASEQAPVPHSRQCPPAPSRSPLLSWTPCSSLPVPGPTAALSPPVLAVLPGPRPRLLIFPAVPGEAAGAAPKQQPLSFPGFSSGLGHSLTELGVSDLRPVLSGAPPAAPPKAGSALSKGQGGFP